jgi:hypothetical protein
MKRLACFFALLCLSTQARAAAPIVTSAAPDQVGVTIYANPNQGGQSYNSQGNPTSIAFIYETRSVELPPGVVTIRFEGVASGIVPQSAILFGSQPRERNRDAALLSQRGLVDAFTGQQVLLKRTNAKTGEISETPATIRSAADRLIVTTEAGSEAIYCSGLDQTLIYPNTPATLSAKPVLSMTTRDQPGGRATITLAYIATGFDWNANYVATLADNGTSMTLTSWLTMASGDATSFVNAQAAVMAGSVNRSPQTNDYTSARLLAEAASLDVTSRCWPAATTSDVPTFSRDRGQYFGGFGVPPPPSPAPPPPPEAAEAVVVTGMRMASVKVVAQASRLGDLVLYRIPVPVTVAAQSQKQVAFLANKRVSGQLVRRGVFTLGASPASAEMMFRFTNDTRSGLGEPLPAGLVTMYQNQMSGRQLLGEIPLQNKTRDEVVELPLGNDPNLIIEKDEAFAGAGERYIVYNDNPTAVTVELEFDATADAPFVRLPPNVKRVAGKTLWVALLPAYSRQSVSFTRRRSN